jgi:hypothetical protein
MTLDEMKRKVLGLIEELNPDSEVLTDDPDIATKLNDVINQIQFELARIKKIAKYADVEVSKGDVLTLEDIGNEVGYDVYQLGTISGVNHKYRANGSVVQFLEDGIAEIDCFVYPEQITDKTKGNYEFELSMDCLEIMPYGVAADLLKSDISTEYGTIYATRYESMLQRLDPRNHMTSIYIEGGVSF